jgi:polyferredoxin
LLSLSRIFFFVFLFVFLLVLFTFVVVTFLLVVFFIFLVFTFVFVFRIVRGVVDVRVSCSEVGAFRGERSDSWGSEIRKLDDAAARISLRRRAGVGSVRHIVPEVALELAPPVLVPGSFELGADPWAIL